MTPQEIDILNSSIKELIKILSDKPDYSGIYLIGSTFVGGLLAMIPSYFSTRKEKKTKLIELTSEAARLSKLLSLLDKELIMHKVHKQYWYRFFSLEEDREKKEKWYEYHRASGVAARETESKIYSCISEYFKVLISFEISKGKHNIITTNSSLIDNFKMEKSSRFESISNQAELPNALREEELRLNNYIKSYHSYYDNINNKMIKLIS